MDGGDRNKMIFANTRAKITCAQRSLLMAKNGKGPAKPSLGYVGDFLRNNSHWIGIFGILFGLTMSTFFYFASKQKGEVSVQFKTVKIAQSGVPILKFFDDKNQEITTNVFGLEAIIWNSGDIALGSFSDRVRQPLTLSLPQSTKILGAVVQETKNVVPSDINLQDNSDQKTVVVQWRQFDPSDAIKIFTIYTGTSESDIGYIARIIGARITNTSGFKETYPATSALSYFYDRLIFNLTSSGLRGILLSLAIDKPFYDWSDVLSTIAQGVA